MSTSALALQQSIFATLTTAAALTTLLGGAAIYDETPQPSRFPFITFGQSTLREASTATEPGDEHIVTLHVWSRAHGRSETHAILGAVRTALHDQPLALAGHHLINLRHEFSEARRDPDGETIHGIIRFRAVTEPL